MSKRNKRRWDMAVFDSATGEVDVEEIRFRREYDEEGNPTGYEPTAYAAPEQLDKLFALPCLPVHGPMRSRAKSDSPRY